MSLIACVSALPSVGVVLPASLPGPTRRRAPLRCPSAAEPMLRARPGSPARGSAGSAG